MRASVLGAILLAAACLSTGVWAAGSATLPPGDHVFDVDHAGKQRRYYVHVPPQAAGGQALPVVVNYHGGGGNAKSHKRYSGLDRLADREGVLAVYPDGTGRFAHTLLTWNAGTCCGRSVIDRVDDVGFTWAALADLGRRTAVDRTRVYATGMSNGAMMAHRLAAESADRVAAIAPVAGSMVLVDFRPSRPVPVMHIHSVDDGRALYTGGLGPPFPLTNVRVLHPAVETSLTRWARNNLCQSTPAVVKTLEGAPGTADASHTATRLEYAPAAGGAAVVHWKLTGAGHVWPGSSRKLERLLGAPTRVIDADEEMWRFFARYSRPDAPPLDR